MNSIDERQGIVKLQKDCTHYDFLMTQNIDKKKPKTTYN